MIERSVLAVVKIATCLPWLTLSAGLLLTGLAVTYLAGHFAMTTDTSQLISSDLDWRKREIRLAEAFPQHNDTIQVVIDGRTPEITEKAAQDLFTALTKKGATPLADVRRRDGGPFFNQNGLLYVPLDDVKQVTEGLIKAQPILGTLTADPSLNGLAKALSFAPAGIQAERASWADFNTPLTTLATVIDDLLDNKPAAFSWGELLSGGAPKAAELRRFIEVKPVLDFNDLQPGAQATDLIRATARDLELTADHGVRVRLTGSVPMADEEFATLAEGAEINGVLTAGAVILILWMALRSAKIIFAVLVSLIVGLALTAAAGIWLVGAFNLISVAFAVLFVGIGVDFGIQFAVRYRQDRHECNELRPAITAAAANVGLPLVLAAASTTAGFYAFLPTAYRGVSELGLIAGTGMMIAFLTSITVLPALLVLLNAPGEPRDVGYRSLAPVDVFMARHRRIILAVTAIAVAAGLPLLQRVEFDFNPINLRSADAESVSTYSDLLRDPVTAPNTIEILAPSLDAAKSQAKSLDSLPEVDHTITLASFIPEQQAEKLAVIADAVAILGPTLDPADRRPPPSDAETVATLIESAQAFADVRDADGGSPLALRMAATLSRLAKAAPGDRRKVEKALLDGLTLRLSQMRTALKAEPISLDRLPSDLVRDWMTGDGQARVQVSPRGDGSNNANIRRFAAAVLAVAPEATGVPILIQESANTVVTAFIQAGVLALVSITVILFLALRRVADVLMTLVPLLLAGVVTLELTVLLGLPLNFANVIALPLLLGVGVAFKIYYVLAWRDGETSLLASPLTRAVIFSAMTTATAFGSLWFSNHPGTSSMGKLLSLSLLATLAAAVLFQPILMGPPRDSGGSGAK